MILFGKRLFKELAANQQIIRYQVRNYVPRRAILYVPGDDKRKIKKASELKVDCVAFDCEDGVALNQKNEARESIREFFQNEATKKEIQKSGKSTEWAVRLNAINSGLCEKDLEIITSGESIPATLLLPKCDSSEDIKCFLNLLRKNVTKSNILEPINLIIYAESSRSMLNLQNICKTASELGSASGLFKPVGIVFGSDDFCADIGATRTESSIELLYARQKIVLIAKSFELQAIDMVYIDYKNLIGLKEQSEAGARMGYTGKQIIHPGQIETVQTAFLPSLEKVEWATGLLTAFYLHQKSGKGAFVYKNQMIDMPTMKQAQNILDVIKNVK